MPEEVLGGENREDGQITFTEKPGDTPGSLEIFPTEEKDAAIEGKRERVEEKYNAILSQVVPTSAPVAATDEDATLDAKSIGDTADEESKIQKLLDLASTKGVVHAVKVARSLTDYYALDRMHDELVDKLYEGLLQRGLITKE